MPLAALPNEKRKSTGAYYTPQPLIDLLLTHALPPTDSPLKILDPSCGPGAFLTAQSFDLILGNPPYVNAIEHRLTPAYKDLLRKAFPTVRGAADLAHYFLAQAIHLVRPGGRIAFVLPRAILNSPAAQRLRANLPPHLRPNLLYAPERHDFFPGANIFTCLLILGPNESCLASTDPHPESATFHRVDIKSDNWWSPLAPPLSGRACAPTSPPANATPPTIRNLELGTRNSPTLASHFQISASMTAAEAYDALPHLADTPDPSPHPRFITTGLIDPAASLWGQKTCRYLKRDYHHPRLVLSDALPPSLKRRAANARRPKILLAGLAKRIEAFLDPTGQYLGAVSTFTILHPTDDVPALEKLLDHLLAPPTTDHLVHHLGANALRGRHITLKKQYLLALPLPQAFVASSPDSLACFSNPDP